MTAPERRQVRRQFDFRRVTQVTNGRGVDGDTLYLQPSAVTDVSVGNIRVCATDRVQVGAVRTLEVHGG